MLREPNKGMGIPIGRYVTTGAESRDLLAILENSGADCRIGHVFRRPVGVDNGQER